MKRIGMILLTGLLFFCLSGRLNASSLTELPPLTSSPTSSQVIKPPPKLPSPEKQMEQPVAQPGAQPPVAAKTPPAQPQSQPAAPETLHPGFPFYPSLIQFGSDTPPSLDDFTGAPVCGVCHKAIYEQWKGSMHAAAFTDPIWRALVAMGSEETAGKIDKYCIGCHTPVGLVTGDVHDVEGIFSEDTDLVSTYGVQCDACHVMSESDAAKSDLGEPGNGSFVMAPGKVKRGPYEDCDAKAHSGIWSSLHVTSKICANCHQSFHGNAPLERTYDEWKHSVYAQHGIQCQHCHMMPVDKAVEAARTLKPPVISGPASELRDPRSPFFPHWFLGANAPMAQQNGYQDHAREIMHRLQTAASLEMEVSDAVVTPGQLIKVKVKVRNVAAGHNLPTSLTEIRQMWLNVRVSDMEGRVFYHSGDLTDTGAIEQGTTIFNSAAVDKNGLPTIKPWEIDHFVWNHTIPPKGMAMATYILQIPKGIRKEVRVTVKLRYRSYPQALVNMLLKDKTFTVPIIDMAEKRLVLPVVVGGNSP